MNRNSFRNYVGVVAFTVTAGLLLFTGRLNSQYAAPGSLETPETKLAEIKAANAAVLQKQQAALQRLDTLQQEADQIRIYTKRG